MANTDPNVALVVLKRPIGIPRSDGQHVPAKYILCVPQVDKNSPTSSIIESIDTGLSVFGIRLVIPKENIDAIFYETTTSSLDSALTNASKDLWGYVDLSP